MSTNNSNNTPMETTTTTADSSSSLKLLEVTLQEAIKDVVTEKYDNAISYFEDSTKNPNDALLDYLITKLLTTTTTTSTSTNNNIDPHLHLVVLLVRRKTTNNNNKNWMIPISKSLLKSLQNNNDNNSVTVSLPSSTLLQVWMEQMIMTDSSLIHENLFKALKILLSSKQQNPSTLNDQVLQYLSVNWKESLESKSTSVASVRCAQVFIQVWSVVTASSNVPPPQVIMSTMAEELLLPMIVNNGDDNDPLLQISVLDMVLQELQQQHQQDNMDVVDDNPASSSSTSSNNNTNQDQEDLKVFLAQKLPWQKLLSSKDSFEFASSLPLAAEVFDSLSNENQSYLLKHAILDEIGPDPTTNETERLLVCSSFLSIFAGSSGGSSNKYLHVLETNSTLRKCWWGDISRIHVPKLQAAVLVSFSKFLESTKVIKVYTWLGIDNNNYNTTEWIYEKFIKSPIPELRIAAYTVWSSLLKNVPNGCVVLGQITTTIPTLFEWLQRRETTYDARTAKYELVLAMNQNSSTFDCGGDDPKFTNLLKKQVELGPHGMEPMSWDAVMVE